MILPEPKRTIPKDHKDAYLDFREVLRSLKSVDPEVYQKAIAVMKPEEWRAMLATLKEKNPEFYRRGTRLLRAAKAGLGDPEQVRQISRELEDGYKCDEGLTEVPPKRTVVVRLKHPEVITGLPKEIMHQSIVLAKEYGGKRKWTFGFDNRAFTVDLEPAAIEELRKHPEVEEVEEAGEATILMANENPTYNPAGINTDWGVTRMPVSVPWGLTPPLYGAGIKVCVIDTGIGKDHQSFWKDGVCVFKGGWNFVAGNNNPADDHDHGTYCCFIVAGQHNGIAGSYRGIAPGVELYAVKVLDSKGSGSMANVAAGIDWARENGMHIINLSLGGPGATVLQQACDAAWYAGCLLVAAAGNSGPGDNTVAWPAAYLSVIAVAAVDFEEYVADFSSRGPQVEVAAPGRYITGALMGFTYKSYAVPGSGDRYFTASGTSAACPHVAAAAALIKNWYPLATNLELRTLLREHLRDI